MTMHHVETQVTREIVPGPHRVAVTEKLFGIFFPLELEPTIYMFAERLSETYKGGYWDYFTLNNGGWYMAPSDDRHFHVISNNFYEGEVSSDSFGLASCLFALSHLSFVGSATVSDLYADMYQKIWQFALSHPEARQIIAVCD